ncbi:DUF6461 domain-containing protein [Marmoricola sp. RAF53]|uniref:DUF6461 domain-containing protein n=1 Tax=Marmoricola sp. RAF53 TaxID=3233059 RepID=UPI003F98A303
MTATPEYYDQVLDAFGDTESLTVLIVAGRTIPEVAAAVGADLGRAVRGEDAFEDDRATVWSFTEVPGGVLAAEPSGYGDPSLDALRALSAGGGAAATVRNNVQGHFRFGCARDGEVHFDEDEFMYIEDPEVVPAELRPLFDLVWDDLEDEIDEDDDAPTGWSVGLAMAEVATGIRVTKEEAARLSDATLHPAPQMLYVLAFELEE